MERYHGSAAEHVVTAGRDPVTDGGIDPRYLIGFEDMIEGEGYDESLYANAHEPDTDDEEKERAAAFDRPPEYVNGADGDFLQGGHSDNFGSG